MGNSASKRGGDQDTKFTLVTGIYKDCDWDPKVIRKLVLDKKISPLYPGVDTEAPSLEECPICLLKPMAELSTILCPFCNHSSYGVVYTGPLSQEEVQKDEIEKAKVLELTIQMKKEENEKAKVGGFSPPKTLVPPPIVYSPPPPPRNIPPSRNTRSSSQSHSQNSSFQDMIYSGSYSEKEVEELMVLEAIRLSLQQQTPPPPFPTTTASTSPSSSIAPTNTDNSSSNHINNGNDDTTTTTTTTTSTNNNNNNVNKNEQDEEFLDEIEDLEMKLSNIEIEIDQMDEKKVDQQQQQVEQVKEEDKEKEEEEVEEETSTTNTTIPLPKPIDSQVENTQAIGKQEEEEKKSKKNFFAEDEDFSFNVSTDALKKISGTGDNHNNNNMNNNNVNSELVNKSDNNKCNNNVSNNNNNNNNSIFEDDDSYNISIKSPSKTVQTLTTVSTTVSTSTTTTTTTTTSTTTTTTTLGDQEALLAITSPLATGKEPITSTNTGGATPSSNSNLSLGLITGGDDNQSLYHSNCATVSTSILDDHSNIDVELRSEGSIFSREEMTSQDEYFLEREEDTDPMNLGGQGVSGATPSGFSLFDEKLHRSLYNLSHSRQSSTNSNASDLLSTKSHLKSKSNSKLGGSFYKQSKQESTSDTISVHSCSDDGIGSSGNSLIINSMMVIGASGNNTSSPSVPNKETPLTTAVKLAKTNNSNMNMNMNERLIASSSEDSIQMETSSINSMATTAIKTDDLTTSSDLFLNNIQNEPEEIKEEEEEDTEDREQVEEVGQQGINNNNNSNSELEQQQQQEEQDNEDILNKNEFSTQPYLVNNTTLSNSLNISNDCTH
ncbi:hypothetical protein DFA_08484 [Cavenderia fasciculata]|uniref:Uncharacterized protein n=1 Tax=Cavenderia fasciculata TaxID=261658 RepID=F4Q2M1_CACFS|nr:uncharacterized protein DFA_08484 [Cavenderia fasciculata]EGG17488.1 hypothetical protein DFA_08484 [Cavenderia fasciculata]|eukprot:XP_004355972.1 hypothetical protein DFA_08484 [Cavenderia fasciculata]